MARRVSGRWCDWLDLRKAKGTVKGPWSSLRGPFVFQPGVNRSIGLQEDAGEEIAQRIVTFLMDEVISLKASALAGATTPRGRVVTQCGPGSASLLSHNHPFICGSGGFFL
jgi:hypothetical protein